MADEYQITGQVREDKLATDGRSVVSGFTITYQDLQTGVSSTVFVPDSQYSAENVQMQIRAQLDAIRGVHSLTD